MTEKSPRDLAADARHALVKLRTYAVEHSSDITGAIDKLGDFVDKQTQGRYAERIDRVQATAKRAVHTTLGTQPDPAHAGETTDPFSLDEPPTWTQPPGSTGAHTVGEHAKPTPADDVKAALAKLRAYAANHADDVSGLVDKVGDFVDRQTSGKYADRIDKAQAAAKTQIGKLK